MAYDVRLSELAIFDIESIATYVALHWSENVKMNFLVDVSEKLILLETLPFIYRKSLSRPAVRGCVVNKHILMYYIHRRRSRKSGVCFSTQKY